MDFAELLDKYSIRYEVAGPNTRAGWLQLDCPWCGGHLYLGYNTHGGYANCWRCGGKSAAALLCELSGESYGAVRKLLESVDVASDAPLGDVPRGQLVIPDGVGDLESVHRTYLESRGFVGPRVGPDSLVKLWQLRGIGLVPRLRWRLWIPVHLLGKTVSWTSRSVGKRNPNRYLAARPSQEVYPLKTLIYGEDYVRHAVLLVEGPLDVWAVGPGTVCSFGTGYKREQLARLAKFPVRYVCYDAEPRAQAQALRVCESLKVFEGATYNVVLDYKDPADCLLSAGGRRELRRLRRLLH